LARVVDILIKEGFDVTSYRPVDLDTADANEWRDPEPPLVAPFEDPKPATHLKQVGADLGPEVEPIFTYFIDGSRKTYRVADLGHKGRFYPLIAAQIGVATCKRERTADGGLKMVPVQDHCRVINTLVFPNTFVAADIKAITEALNKSSRRPFEVLTYTVKPDKSPVDLAVAAAMQKMHEMEVTAAVSLADGNFLSSSNLLVIDGSIMFTKQKFDLSKFRNVIGIAKSFQPNFTIGSKKKEDVGSIVRKLHQRERTIVYRCDYKNSYIGRWFLRVHPPERMYGSLGGVIKLELLALDEDEKQNGLSPDRIDTISRHVIAERNVTCYGDDDRWPTHLYPVYLTEKYLKSLFMSEVQFCGLF